MITVTTDVVEARPRVFRTRLVAIGRVAIARSPLVAFAAILIYLALNSSAVLTSSNIWSSVEHAAPVGIIACGLAIVVIGGGTDAVSGGIDLSLPASTALAALVMSMQLRDGTGSFIGAALFALVIVLIVGAINAFLVAIVGLAPILATLATYVSAVGVTRMLSRNRRISVTHPTVVGIRDGEFLGIPIGVYILVVTVVLLWVTINRTRFGAHVQAVGGSLDAATTSGLAVRRYLGSTYLIASAVTVLAAILLMAQSSGSSPGADERLLLDMVLATYIGAAFSARNVVTVVGAALGAVLVAFLSNSLILNGIANYWVDGWKGALILLVVAAAAVQGKRK